MYNASTTTNWGSLRAQLSGATFNFLTRHNGSGTGITTQNYGEDGTGSTLTAINWQFGGVTAASFTPSGATFTGNVGIGVTNPVSKLAVNGIISASEVVVTSSPSDYVFDPDYRLAPLGEVADYVKANHHLPEIPSAAEVIERGVSLGEMQSKLLAKIEELTLHMIQAEDRSDRLERENLELRERMGRVEAGTAGRAQ